MVKRYTWDDVYDGAIDVEFVLASDYAALEAQRDKLAEALRACLARWDWLIQPKTPEPPVFEMERVRELLNSCGLSDREGK